MPRAGLTSPGLGEERFIASDRVSSHLQSIVPHCDLIIGTEEEIHIAGGSTDTRAALKKIRDLTPGTIVLKRGARGCVVFPDAIPDDLDQGVVHPGFPTEVYNVLGAGDGFAAGFLSGWLILLSQKVAAAARCDSDNWGDSGISGWRLIWICERLEPVNRGFRRMSRGL